MMTAKVGLSPETADMLKKLGLETGGRVQEFLAKEVADYCQPYCPWNTGTLARSPYAVSDFKSGQVIYPGPYAHYLYYGEVYGPNIPIKMGENLVAFFSPKGKKKSPTGQKLKYNTDTQPLAGSFWFERMKGDKLDTIVKEVKAYAGKQR